MVSVRKFLHYPHTYCSPFNRSDPLIQCPRGSPQEILHYLQKYMRLLAVSRWRYLQSAYTTSKLPAAPWAGMDTALLRALEACTQITFRVQRQCSKFDVVGPERMLCSYEGDNFVLDQQVVRAALKSFRSLVSTQSPSASTLSPSSYYLRLLLEPTSKPLDLSESSWQDPATSILLLEWRAALLVHEHSRTVAEPDASVNQRVSKAVTEAFIAAQVGEIINSLSLPADSTPSVRALYILVSPFPLIVRDSSVLISPTVSTYDCGICACGPIVLWRVLRSSGLSFQRSCAFSPDGYSESVPGDTAQCNWVERCIWIHRLGA
jgi:hypothetical protein